MTPQPHRDDHLMWNGHLENDVSHINHYDAFERNVKLTDNE